MSGTQPFCPVTQQLCTRDTQGVLVIKDSKKSARPSSPAPTNNNSPPDMGASDEPYDYELLDLFEEQCEPPSHLQSKTKVRARSNSPLPAVRIQELSDTEEESLGSELSESDSAERYDKFRRDLTRPAVSHTGPVTALSDTDSIESVSNSASDQEPSSGSESESGQSQIQLKRIRIKGTNELEKHPEIYKVLGAYPVNNSDNKELFDILPKVHQQPDHAMTEEKQFKIMLVGQHEQRVGKGRTLPDSGVNVTTMANWTPSDDKVSAITNASWHSYQLGCMAGHFVTKAQKFCLTRFAAQNPDWMPKSIAGRFFLDHLQIGKEASKLKKSPTGQSEDWVQAKKKECPKYVDLTSGYSDNETASQSQAEKVSAKKAHT